jgi:AraC family transcriptional activator of pobA
MSVSEIAFETGFEDVSYFGRFFKKHTGFAPTEYRNMIELSE